MLGYAGYQASGRTGRRNTAVRIDVHTHFYPSGYLAEIQRHSDHAAPA
jgi:hypothetical protein